NNAAMPVKVEAGKTNEYQTATLSVKSAGDQYYYVLDRNGTELGHNKFNAPLAFTEGVYSVKVANETRPVTLTAAKITVGNWKRPLNMPVNSADMHSITNRYCVN